MADPKEPFVVQVGSKRLDLTMLKPLTLRDKRLLLEQGLDLKKLTEFTVEQEVAFIMFVLKKHDAELSKDDVESLPMRAASDIFVYIGQRTAEGGLARPT